MASQPGSKSRNDSVEGYRGLRQKAKGLISNLLHLQAQQKKFGTPETGLSVRTQAVLKDQAPSGTVSAGPPGKAHLVARAIQDNPEKAMDIVIADLEDFLYYMRGGSI